METFNNIIVSTTGDSSFYYDFGQPTATPQQQQDISLGLFNKMVEESFSNPSGQMTNVYDHDCCAKCINNPKNNPNATGVCHCALPTMHNIRY